MFTDRDLRELLDYEAHTQVLSVYLSTDPAEGNADAYKLRLRSMLKEIELSEDVNAVLRYFDHEHDWSGRGVAIFSCAPEGFFRNYPFQVKINNRVRISDRPHVKPLIALLDFYGGYGVVLVDKQQARLFSFHLGELQEHDGVVGESVRHTKRGGGSQSPGRRGGVAGQTDYVEEVTDRNIKESVTYATQFFKEITVRRVLIGGSDENVSLFRSQLPKAWQSLVVGTFPMSMTASHNEVLARAMTVGEEAELRQELSLVEATVTSSAKGKGGILGLEEVLGAVREGRVNTLLIQNGYRETGLRCKSCGYTTAQTIQTCPYCGGDFAKITDVVEVAVRQVISAGGDVEVLQKDYSSQGFNKIGGLLRY